MAGIFPLNAVDESIDIPLCTCSVVLKLLLERKLGIVDGSLNQPFVKITVAELRNLFQSDVSHLIQSLALFRTSHSDKLSVIGHTGITCREAEHLLLLHDVKVNQTGRTIVEDSSGNLGNSRGLQVGSTRQTPCHSHIFSLQSINFLDNRLSNGGFSLILQLRNGRIGLPVSEILLNGGHHLIGVEITRQTDADIVGHIISGIVILHIGDGRILQMLLGAQRGLLTVGMIGEKCLVERFPHLAAVLGKAHVLLLINRLQLGVETADDIVTETVGLNAGPVVNLV